METNQILVKTGERMIEEDYKHNKSDYFIYLCHIATYNFVVPFIKNKKVLEFGCGSGYGSYILANHCKHITAVDISEKAIEYANTKYKHENLNYEVIQNIEKINMGYKDNSFDVVVSFQVIEHISNTNEYMKELYRVLKPSGKIIIVTPDRVSRLFKFQKPWNMYHVKEFDTKMLTLSMKKYFNILDVYFMTAREDLLNMEINRTKKLRLLSLPFTLFFIPEFLRIFFIRIIKKATQKRKNHPTTENFNFSVDDIFIKKGSEKTLNIFVVAEK